MKRLLLLFTALLLLTTCTAQNRLPGHVYYRLSTNPTTLDPALVVDVTGGLLAAKVFNGLVRLDSGLHVVPDIAEGWTVSGDGLTYRFTLKKGVRFSNGREVKAGDFKYSFQRVLDPATRSPSTWVFDKVLGARQFMRGQAGEVKGIRAVDDYTLEIRLSRPFSPFLSLLTMTAAYVVPREAVEERGLDFSSLPVGTGPFVLKEWLTNQHLIFERRADYFERPARVLGIVYRVIPEDLTAVAEFEIGNLDVMTIPSSEYSRYRDSPRRGPLVSSIKGINTYYLGLNCSKPPFDDPGLRRAMNLAIDRRKILATLYEGRGRPAVGPVPDLLRRWPPPEAYQYDPDKARAVIEKAEPPEVDFYITADQEVVDVAEVIQSYLRDAGLKVRIRQLEWSAFKEAINRGEPNMFWLSWWADYPDPENFLFPLFHSSNIGPSGNRVRYTNPEVDALIEAGQNATSEANRDRDYERAERLIVRDAPWVFFWHRTDFTLRQQWVKHYEIYPIYSMDKGTEISLE
jgi:oligopeptide transport system substrate-binding protein